ncbi:MAG TPA: GDSL-type esterase/lipase family protein [Planctomycetota bacterium]|nr:GDSL-type esterase/lipase family protein [Planctomycetota bacterium]
MKRALKITSLVAGALLLLLLAAELLASFTPSGNAAPYVEDPVMLCVRKPDTEGYSWGNGRWIACHINKQGLRGEDLPVPRDPAESWVLCVGDSFTFGGGVETAEAWPQQMQGLLGAPEQSGVRVLNGGANGWSTHWQRVWLEQRALDEFDPDVVVLGWNWNDLNGAEGGPDDALKGFIHAEGTWLQPFAQFELLRESHLFRWFFSRRISSGDERPTDAQLRKRLQNYKATMDRIAVEPETKLLPVRARLFGDGPTDEEFWRSTDTQAWKAAREELGRMRDLCAARGAVFVVAMLPEPSWFGTGTYPGVARLGSMLDALGVPWVDLMPAFMGHGPDGSPQGRDPDLWLRYDPVHPTPEGQALFAEAVARLLREKDLLAPRSR